MTEHVTSAQPYPKHENESGVAFFLAAGLSSVSLKFSYAQTCRLKNSLRVAQRLKAVAGNRGWRHYPGQADPPLGVLSDQCPFVVQLQHVEGR